MEKISHIVGGSARVGATDNMSAPAVRPGTPSFGRPIGSSPGGERDQLSTAQRASAIQGDMLATKKMRSEGRAMSDMSSQFFGSRTAEEPRATAGKEGEIPHEISLRATSGEKDAYANGDIADLRAPPTTTAPQPSKYTPRGSFVDVHA